MALHLLVTGTGGDRVRHCPVPGCSVKEAGGDYAVMRCCRRAPARDDEHGFELLGRDTEGKRATAAPATAHEIVREEHQKLCSLDHPQRTATQRGGR